MSELLIPFGEMPDGRLVRATDVERGTACGCVCPGCRSPMVARQGDVLRPHFAHVAETCPHALESTLHKLAKQIIADTGYLTLPPLSGQRGPMKVTFDKVDIEETIQGKRPDLLVWKAGRALAVEIRVTHSPDEDKLNALAAIQLPVVELDLSGINRENLGDLTASQVTGAPSRWLYHPKIEAAEARIALEAARMEAAAVEAQRVALKSIERSLLAKESTIAAREKEIAYKRQDTQHRAELLAKEWHEKEQTLQRLRDQAARVNADLVALEQERSAVTVERQEIARLGEMLRKKKLALHAEMAAASPLVEAVFNAFPDSTVVDTSQKGWEQHQDAWAEQT